MPITHTYIWIKGMIKQICMTKMLKMWWRWVYTLLSVSLKLFQMFSKNSENKAPWQNKALQVKVIQEQKLGTRGGTVSGEDIGVDSSRGAKARWLQECPNVQFLESPQKALGLPQLLWTVSASCVVRGEHLGCDNTEMTALFSHLCCCTGCGGSEASICWKI